MKQGMKIEKGDIVLHTPSGLYYRCEDNKQSRWMVYSGFYLKQKPDVVPASYFFKNIGKRGGN